MRLLAEERGGVRALRRFCASVGRGAEWRRAFRDSFGISTQRFYAKFERRRREVR